MDLVDYRQDVFDRIVADYREFADKVGLRSVTSIPISALKGDGISDPSPAMPWSRGPTLMQWLETVEVEDVRQAQPFRLAVQWVNRPNPDFRGFAGMVSSGTIRPGDRLRVLPAGKESQVARIVTQGGDLAEAVAGQSVTLTLADEIDISRGDVLSDTSDPPGVADQFETTLIWMAEEPMLPGRPYWLKLGTQLVSATITDLKYVVNVNTLEHVAAKTLELNGIGVCNVNVGQPMAFDPYAKNQDTGGFILIDRMSNATVGAGLIHFALRRSQNIHWQSVDINKTARAVLKGQKGCILWFTGLSGAGKSTIANLVERRLHAGGRHTYLLDGDNVRHGLNKDLGFTDADRVENIRRVAEVARLMVDAGLIVLASFISPFRSERRMARELVESGEFIEVFVDVPLMLAERRDPKGLYKKARRGEIKHFTGIDSPYEVPEHAEITIDTSALAADKAADVIVQWLVKNGIVESV
jgi:bifunctional enzyme CysN/CysC